jgi:hypothetical protein
MLSLLRLRAALRRHLEATFQKELLAACAPRRAASAEAHSLDAFEGLFAASLISTIFWLLLIALLSS